MPKLWNPLLVVALVLVAGAGCGEENPPPEATEPPPGPGLVTTPSRRAVDGVLDRVEAEIKDDDGSRAIVSRLDYADEADAAGRELTSTGAILFDAPELAAPLLERNQLVGLDLPLTVLAWDRPDEGSTRVTHDTPEYLAARHDLGDAPELESLGERLREVVRAGAGAGNDPRVGPADTASGDGIEDVRSDADVAETVSRLESAVEAERGLTVAETVDHRREARSEGVRLRPTTLVLVEDARGGPRLLEGARTLGVDLPLRFLVYEGEDGQVTVAYEGPEYLAERHALRGAERALERVGDTSAELAGAAAGR